MEQQIAEFFRFFSKNVFLKQIQQLRTVDSVLTVWQKVQMNWCRLEPIFMLAARGV